MNIVTSKSSTLQPDATVTGVVVSTGHIQVTAAHNLTVGDIVQIQNVIGSEVNGFGIVASVSGTASFTLEQAVGSITAYGGSGLVRHRGWASPLVVTDNTVIDNTADLNLNVRLEALSDGTNCRIEIEDGFGANTTAQTVATFNAAGAIKNSVSDYVVSRRLYQMPDLRIGNSGCFMRAKLLFPSGAPGNSATFSAWLEV